MGWSMARRQGEGKKWRNAVWGNGNEMGSMWLFLVRERERKN
jgi:hypothetical protein